MRLPLLLLIALLSAPVALAHESWLQPQSYRVGSGDAIIADIRVGENFKGTALSYFPTQVSRLSMISGETETDLTPRMGDKPAIQTVAPKRGLVTLVHVTAGSFLTYSEWQKFLNFVSHKDFPGLPQAHLDRGLPQTKFRESYTRHVKSLIAVGDGTGMDRQIGLRTEIVALANPYLPLSGDLPVQVFFEGQTRPDAQVEVFEMAPDGSVEVSLTRTDADGVAQIPVKTGYAYLLDAVVLLDTGNDDVKAGPVWESHWAALTFQIPAQ